MRSSCNYGDREREYKAGTQSQARPRRPGTNNAANDQIEKQQLKNHWLEQKAHSDWLDLSILVLRLQLPGYQIPGGLTDIFAFVDHGVGFINYRDDDGVFAGELPHA